jgi:selenide,water dikinase
VLGRLARQHDPNVLVGFDKADDAGVYKISAEQALVQTVDFFTPIVDDPFTFGAIAATNALSDVYAMGGRPLTALALVCFPEKGDLAVLEQILAGGLAKMVEAGCTVVGGHSIRDEEVKFGYAVTGTIHPKHVFTNAAAQPGDALLLTKPLGTGVISTAIKKGKAAPEWIDAASKSMTTLNRAAAEIMARPEFGVHAATDVTGFGLMGHALAMAEGSGVTLVFEEFDLPLMPGVLEYCREGMIPGGGKRNRDFYSPKVKIAEEVGDDMAEIAFDPQTSGGLLIALPEDDALRLLADLKRLGNLDAAIIGRATEPGPLPLELV